MSGHAAAPSAPGGHSGPGILDGLTNGIKHKAHEIKGKATAKAVNLTGPREGGVKGEGLSDITKIPLEYMIVEGMVSNVADRATEVAGIVKTATTNNIQQIGQVVSNIAHPINSVLDPLNTVKNVAMTPIVGITEAADAVASLGGSAIKGLDQAYEGFIGKPLDALADDIDNIPVIKSIPIVKWAPGIISGGLNLLNKGLSTPTGILNFTRKKVGGVMDTTFNKVRDFASSEGSKGGGKGEAHPAEHPAGHEETAKLTH